MRNLALSILLAAGIALVVPGCTTALKEGSGASEAQKKRAREILRDNRKASRGK